MLKDSFRFARRVFFLSLGAAFLIAFLDPLVGAILRDVLVVSVRWEFRNWWFELIVRCLLCWKSGWTFKFRVQNSAVTRWRTVVFGAKTWQKIWIEIVYLKLVRKGCVVKVWTSVHSRVLCSSGNRLKNCRYFRKNPETSLAPAVFCPNFRQTVTKYHV